MGFGGYIGGIAVCVIAVVLVIIGFVVLLGFAPFIPGSFSIIAGLVILVIALILFLYGRYMYLSSRPKGTINVHNV
jgi:hypothetical protein